jgi:hypothetical protein
MKIAQGLSKLVILIVGLIATASFAANIVVSGSTLDIDIGNKFDEAIITISGPDGFAFSHSFGQGETQVDIDTLGITAAGNYTYQIQYIQHGKTEYITDATTGRQGAKRNTGPVKIASGFFNVNDHEFVTEEVIEPNFEGNTQQIQANSVATDNKN